MNTECILHSNNARDAESDKKTGIVTIAILFGYTGSYILYIVLLFVPYFIFLALAFQKSIWFLVPMITLPMAFNLEKLFRFNVLQHLPQKTASLNLIFGLLYVLACFAARQI
jgi:1,4-dihydroxy-2-naphthoate octaprenyltransferase